jgi:hypothetical protein
LRSANDNLALSNLRPLDRARSELDIKYRDLNERNSPGAPASGAGLRGALGLNAGFMGQLAQLIAAVPGISITSGFRSHDEQADLYARKPGLAAPPGHSNHEFGLAADLAFATPQARAQAHALAGQYGLRFPMSYEPWHVEPVGARAMRTGASPAAASGDIAGTFGAAKGADSAALFNQYLGGQMREATDALREQNAQLVLQAQNFGKTTEEIAKASKAQELLNQYRRLTDQPLSDDYRAKIEQVAEAYGRAAKGAEELARQQKQVTDALDLVRGGARDFLSTFATGLAHGEKGIDALRDAMRRLGDTFINSGVNALTDSLFGKQGTVGGSNPGIFGGLLSKLFSGFSLGGGGGGGGVIDLNTKFAGGGVMTSHGVLPLRRYSEGGVATSPQLAMFGEGSEPEAYVPLKDGRAIDVKLRGANQNAPALHYQAGDTHIHVDGSADQRTLDRMQSMLAENNAASRQQLQRDFGTMMSNFNKRFG